MNVILLMTFVTLDLDETSDLSHVNSYKRSIIPPILFLD